MLELELATTEQILEELARRPMSFVFVSLIPEGHERGTGLLAHSPELDDIEALNLLRRAEQFFVDAEVDGGEGEI